MTDTPSDVTNDQTAAPGHSAVHAQTRMEDAMRQNPNLPVVLMRFHIGGCSLCGYEPGDTVEQVAEDNGVPLDVLLAAMNERR